MKGDCSLLSTALSLYFAENDFSDSLEVKDQEGISDHYDALDAVCLP